MADNKYNNEGRGALWIKTAKSGLKYLSGSVEINGIKIYLSCFKNDNKSKLLTTLTEGSDEFSKAQSQPDYNLVVNDPQGEVESKPEKVKPVDEELPF